MENLTMEKLETMQEVHRRINNASRYHKALNVLHELKSDGWVEEDTPFHSLCTVLSGSIHHLNADIKKLKNDE